MVYLVHRPAIACVFCRSPSIPIGWKRWHKLWCFHVLGLNIEIKHKNGPKYMSAGSSNIASSPNTLSKKKTGIQALFYCTGNFAQISAGMSGTAELLRTSDYGDKYTKYKVAVHKSRMFWEALDIWERDKELKSAFWSMPFLISDTFCVVLNHCAAVRELLKRPWA